MGDIGQLFISEVQRIINEARSQGKTYVDIVSRDVHINVGGYPGDNHKMPSCCSAMRSLMKNGDIILESPPKGNGATLKIRYFV
jgi:hypothetical protein